MNVDGLATAEARTGSGPPWLLKATMFSVMLFPPYMVLEPVGASGSLPQLLALGLFGLWAASSVLALHDPVSFRHPGRAAVLAFLLASCLSYAHLFAGLSGASTVEGRAAADRNRLRFADRSEAAHENTNAGRDHLPVERGDVATRLFAFGGGLEAVEVVNGDKVLRHRKLHGCGGQPAHHHLLAERRDENSTIDGEIRDAKTRNSAGSGPFGP